MCYFPWKCLTCKHEGEEWYSLEFVGHNVIDENGNNIEKVIIDLEISNDDNVIDNYEFELDLNKMGLKQDKLVRN